MHTQVQTLRERNAGCECLLSSSFKGPCHAMCVDGVSVCLSVCWLVGRFVCLCVGRAVCRAYLRARLWRLQDVTPKLTRACMCVH